MLQWEPQKRGTRLTCRPTGPPKAEATLEGYIRQFANDPIDQLIHTGECEFTKDFGRPLPVSVFLEQLGLPRKRRHTFASWAARLLRSQSHEAEQNVTLSVTVSFTARSLLRAGLPGGLFTTFGAQAGVVNARGADGVETGAAFHR